MSDLIRIYGKSLTTIFLGLTALWIVALIVVPQLRMIERAFVVDRYSDEAARVGVEINRSYTRVFTIDQELDRAAAGPTAPTAPSPFSPLPSSAKPSTPSAFATPSASSGGAVSTDPDRTATLKAEKAELQARIAELEVREKEVKAGGTGYALAILSNGDRDMLEAAGPHIGFPFDHVISVQEAGYFKPHWKTYAKAEELIGLDRSSCLFVANHAFDCIGAKAYGMRAAFIDRR